MGFWTFLCVVVVASMIMKSKKRGVCAGRARHRRSPERENFTEGEWPEDRATSDARPYRPKSARGGVLTTIERLREENTALIKRIEVLETIVTADEPPLEDLDAKASLNGAPAS